MQQMEKRDETFTIQINPNGEFLGAETVTYGGPEAGLQRATDLGSLIKRFAAELPRPVHITFTKHDQPTCKLNWSQKSKMLDMAAQGECASCLRIK